MKNRRIKYLPKTDLRTNLDNSKSKDEKIPLNIQRNEFNFFFNVSSLQSPKQKEHKEYRILRYKFHTHHVIKKVLYSFGNSIPTIQLLHFLRYNIIFIKKKKTSSKTPTNEKLRASTKEKVAHVMYYRVQLSGEVHVFHNYAFIILNFDKF